jgi:hypothetical protein
MQRSLAAPGDGDMLQLIDIASLKISKRPQSVGNDLILEQCGRLRWQIISVSVWHKVMVRYKLIL